MDKEKLFAARKKLKEYQLFKKDNTHNHHITDKSLKDACVKDNVKDTGTYGNACNEVDFQIKNADKSLQLPQEAILFKESTQFISGPVIDINETCPSNNIKENSSLNNAEKFISRINNPVHDLQSEKCKILEKNNTPQNNNNDFDATFPECNDIIINNSSVNTSFTDVNDQSKNMKDEFYKDSSFLQKEYLLQMASSVKQVLGDITDSSETQTVSNLIDKNQFLTNCLQEQTKLVSELHGQVSRQSNKISELEALLAVKDAECEAKVIQEINLLKEQVQLHTHTTAILVAEKAELSSTLDQCYATINQKTELIEDLQKKLKNSQLQIIECFKDSTDSKSNNENVKISFESLQQNYEKLVENFSCLRKEKESLELECSELKQKLNLNNTELMNCQQELKEKQAMLSLNEIKIQQLINSSDQFQSLENEHQTALVFEHQLTQLKDALNSVNNEKDEANKQYKIYLEQSDERYKKLENELKKSHKHNEELQSSEKSYIQRLLEMEQQLQIEREQSESLKPLLEYKDKIEILTRNIDNLIMEQESLQLALTQKDSEIERLSRELQELPGIKESSIDASVLATALESEQLGASRAVSQNQQLKHQLEEMNNAFVLLSNNKLDLTEQLEAERNVCKQLNNRLAENEAEINVLKNQLKVNDKSNHLLKELQTIQILNENLQRENQLLKEELKTQIQLKETKNEDISTVVKEDTTILTTSMNGSNNSLSTEIQPSEAKWDMPEPIKKLEKRFKETMNKVAELTDEKQRLEHLVLQLQEETETIGEYVTLYQKQRSTLQEKAKEREQTFRQIAEQRNHQQEQLQKLKSLVAKLLKLKSADLKRILDAIDNSSLSSNSTKAEDLEEGDHTCNSMESDITKEVENKTYLRDEAVIQLSNLLSEIKDCSGMCNVESNFHPCPLCSGKLITI